MRLYTFRFRNQTHVGVERDGALVKLPFADMLELIRGRCGTVYGHLFALLTILKGLPIGYNRDLQETKAPFMRGARLVLAMTRAVAASGTAPAWMSGSRSTP